MRMTDLERARQTLRRIERSLVAYPRPRGPLTYTANDVEDALAAARREGAELARSEMPQLIAASHREGAAEMRERAAAATAFCCFECSRVIRALPLTPEEPQV